MTSNSASTTSISSSKQAYYLGLDLTPEALRGVVIDDTLDVIAADCVLFDNNAGSISNPNVNTISTTSPGIIGNANPNPLLNLSHSQPSTPTPISSSPSSAPTLSIATILAALDTLLSKLSSRSNFSCIRAISGSAFPGAVFYQSAAFDSASSSSFGSVLDNDRTDVNATLESLLFPSTLSPFLALPTTSTPTDTSITPFAQLLQDSHYGSASNMAAKCGTSAFAGPVSGLIAAQMIKLRVTVPEVWQSVDAVSGLGGLLTTVLTGRGRPSLSVTDALMSGLLDYSSLVPAPTSTPHKSKSEWEWKWDSNTVRFVAGSEGNDRNEAEAQRVLNMIGGLSGQGEHTEGFIASYFVKKYGFGKETSIHAFTSTHLATYLSLVPTSSDAILTFGTQDAMMVSTPGSVATPAFSSLPQPSTLTQTFPHPVQTQGPNSNISHKWISVINARNGDVPRTLVRDMYTKSWSAFDRLVAIVPPGGSIGLDDKLFSYWLIQPEYESSHITPLPPVPAKVSTQPSRMQSQGQATPIRGIYRFENGTKVNEFRDLRANPRCVIEGQIMGFRTRFGRLASSTNTGANATDSNVNLNGSAILNGHHTTTTTSSLTTATPNGHSHGYTTSPSISSTLSPSSSSSFPSTTTATTTSPFASPSLPFSPYTSTPLPKRIFATGSASYFPSIVNVVGEIFNCSIFVPQSVLEEGVLWAALVTAIQQSSGTTSGAGAGEDAVGGEKEKDGAGLTGGDTSNSDLSALSAALARIASRPSIGAAYLARWGWKQHIAGAGALGLSSSSASFEDDIRWLLAKRWAQAQSSSQHQGLSGSGQQYSNSSSSGAGLGFGPGFGLLGGGGGASPLSTSPFSSSFGHSPHGLQTPTSSGPPGLTSPLGTYGHHHLSKTPSRRGLHRAKSHLALASEIVVEEDEEEDEMGGENLAVEEEEGAPRESGVYKYPIPGSSLSAINVSSSSSSLPISPAMTGITAITPTPTPTFVLSQSTTASTSTTAILPSLTLTTTNPTSQLPHQSGPLTSLIGPLPTPAPITSTLHPISALVTNDADAQFGLVKVAEPDPDAFVCYASMLFEWVRLEGGIWGGIW